MKKKSLVLTLALTLMVGLGATAYAATTPANNTYCQGTGTGLGRITGFKGFEIITNVLKGKGVTEAEITDAINAGKILSTLAEEKGITNEQLKSSIVEEKSKIIDAAVANGTITKEQADAAKAIITENTANCTTPGQMTGRMGEQNKSKGLQGTGCLSIATQAKQ